MTASNETLDRNVTAREMEQAKFGHDPRDPSLYLRGEVLDAIWEQEFDRRLAAWEAEARSAVTSEVKSAELAATAQ